MTNRQPHIPEEHREHYEKSSFVNEPAATATAAPAAAPAAKRKPATKKPAKKTTRK